MTLLDRWRNLGKHDKAAAIVILVFSAIVLPLAAIHQVSGDACWHLSAARFMAAEHKIPLNEGLGREGAFWPPPLFHGIAAAAMILSGKAGQFLAKMISPLSSILTLIFAYRVFKKITKEGIALYALVFLAFTPMFIDYSIYSYVEALMLLFVVLSVYYALKNKVWPSAVFVGLGILTKYNAGFILPVLAFIIYNNDMENRQSRGTALWHMVVLCILPLLVIS